MNVLFLGDIVGKPGRAAIATWLNQIKSEYGIDITLANAENAAGGLGVTPAILRDLHSLGIDGFTLGNHTWRKKELAPALKDFPNVVRPANYPEETPGQGSMLLTARDGLRLGVVNLQGRVFIEGFDCPFKTGTREVKALRQQTQFILVDMHAEATAEKVAMGWHLDGRCSAVVGTHTHVQTADERILPGGAAYITDAGMCGPRDSVIGVEHERIVAKFINGMPTEFRIAKGPMMLNGVVLDLDDSTGKARAIRRIVLHE
jgi:2',3'-cyclic-nucleotide 2'-phosphodiesterase